MSRTDLRAGAPVGSHRPILTTICSPCAARWYIDRVRRGRALLVKGMETVTQDGMMSLFFEMLRGLARDRAMP